MSSSSAQEGEETQPLIIGSSDAYSERGLKENTVQWLENYINNNKTDRDCHEELLVEVDTAGCLFGLKGGSATVGRCIPDLYRLTYLRSIKLAYLGLTGEIPSSLCACSCLESIDLGNNKLTGEIPASIGSCKHLRRLCVYNNMITGKS